MFERFTHEARRVVVGAQREAASLNHDRIGTEHILLALMSERAGVGSRVLTELGLERERTRSALLETLEARGSKRQGSDRLSEPDPDALATIGIDLDAVRGAVEETFGPGALERTRARRGRATGREPRPVHRPFTPRAKKVMELSLREAIALRHRHIGTEHLLLAIVREGEGLAALLLVRAGLDPTAIRRSVLEEVARRADTEG
jgi:ATP-dependent Clp protease ATP-binding subunit ClpA